MNSQFRALYNNEIGQMLEVKARIGGKINGPLLINPGEPFANSKRKLVVIGQQTRGWHKFHDVDGQMQHYMDFNLGQDERRSTFWQMVRRLERDIMRNDKYSCAWTNINRFDVAKRRPTDQETREIEKLDGLVAKEIRLLKPDVCVFFTGPDFDGRIRGIFCGAEFPSIKGRSESALCRIRHPDLPKCSFRSYHPSFLRRSSKEGDFLNVIRDVVRTEFRM